MWLTCELRYSNVISMSNHSILCANPTTNTRVWFVCLRAYMYVCECAHECINNKTINKLPIHKLSYSNAIYNSMRSYGLR